MNVVGVTGEHIGTVERFEIDNSGRLKWLVVTLASRLGVHKRIASEYIQSIGDGIVNVSISASEVGTLNDVVPESNLDELWASDAVFD